MGWGAASSELWEFSGTWPMTRAHCKSPACAPDGHGSEPGRGLHSELLDGGVPGGGGLRAGTVMGRIWWASWGCSRAEARSVGWWEGKMAWKFLEGSRELDAAEPPLVRWELGVGVARTPSSGL